MTNKPIFNKKTNRGVMVSTDTRGCLEGEYTPTLSEVQLQMFSLCPQRYEFSNGVLIDHPDWESELATDLRKNRLEAALVEVDKEVQELDKQPFLYGGNLYYPDTEFIQGLFSVLPYLPPNYTEEWKTAEKELDGVKNKKTVLDKAGIVGLALAYLQFKKDNWKAGELKKNTLKEAFLAGE